MWRIREALHPPLGATNENVGFESGVSIRSGSEGPMTCADWGVSSAHGVEGIDMLS